MTRSHVLSFRRESSVVGLGAALGVLVLSWVAVRHSFYAHQVLGDTPFYKGYAELVRQGLVPYRDFSFEYPPGALEVMVPPAYVAGYATAFGWLMALCAAATVVVVYPERPVAAFLVALSPLFVGALVLNRFDYWPSFLVVLAIVLLLHEHHQAGWAALGLAIGVKLWPAAIVPLAVVWTYRRGGRATLERSVAWAAAFVLAVFVPFAVTGWHGLWASVHGQLTRPLQVETLGAALLKVGHHAGEVASYTTQAVTGVAVRPLTWLTGVTLVCVLIAIWIGFARGDADRDELIRHTAAAAAAVVAFGRVLSPQYTIWLVPLVALVRGRRGALAIGLLVAAAVMAQVWYPARYLAYAYHDHLAWLVLLRDAVLVALVAVLALPKRVLRLA